MNRLQLKVQKREGFGKGPARRLRVKGLIPGVIYGMGQDPLALTINSKELEDALKGGGTNVLFDLEIEGEGTVPVMVREYQADVINRDFLHVDFLKVDLNKKVHVDIPIHLVGKAPGVKEGGILEHIRRQIEVICLPTSIPEAIEVDVGELNIGDTIHVHDLKLPEGAELTTTADFTIAAVVAPVEEKVEEVVAEEGAAEPEVIGEKKPDEEEAAPAEDKKEK